MLISDWSSDVCSSDLPEFGERREQEVAGIIAGERPPGAVRAMLSRRQPRERQPGIGIAEGVHGRIPPVGMLGLAFASQRDKAREARTIARRLGSGHWTVNFHTPAIGAAPRATQNRQSGWWGKRGSDRVELGGRR